MSFWGELKRRNVYKVGVAYAIVAWLIVQAAAIVSPALQLPKWTLPFVIIFLSIGFIVTLFLAWAYEVTPEGIKRTKEVPIHESITHLTGKKLNYILAGVIVLAVAFILFDNYYLDRRAVEPEVVSTETDQAPVVTDVEEAPKTIAVLPFVNLSPDPDQEYFVDGLSEELLNCLSKIAGLRVTSRTSSFTFKGSEKTIQEIASVLGVDHILEGSVRKAGDALRISAQLIRAKDDYHLWSETYNRELKDIFVVQEDIATTVAEELKVTLGIEGSLKRLGGTENLAAYELFLVAVARGQEAGGTYSGYQRALKTTDSAIALDPEFALAWAQKAVYQELLAVVSPPTQAASEYEKALIAARKAIELEPDLPEAYASLGSIKSAKGDWIEAEQAYSKAFKSTDGSSMIIATYSMYLFAVGHSEKANKFLQEALRSDPLNNGVRVNYITSLALLGDKQQVERESEHINELFGDQDLSGFITQAHLGLGVYVPKDEISALFDRYGNVEIDLHYPENGILELNRFLGDNIDLPVGYLNNVALVAANLGDYELAMNIIGKLATESPKAIFFAWFPVMHEVRQMRRFKEFVKKIGLVDYWNKFGWPDICRQLDNGDFECD